MDVVSMLFVMWYDVIGTALQCVWIWLHTGQWYGIEISRAAGYHAEAMWQQ